MTEVGAHNAWVLPLRGQLYGAVSGVELCHLMHEPSVIYLPASPSFCKYLIRWGDRFVPVLDLASWLLEGEETKPKFLAVVMFQDQHSRNWKHGSIVINTIPRRIQIEASAPAVQLPQNVAKWRDLFLSCFDDPETGPVPVLNLSVLFSDLLVKSDLSRLAMSA